MIVSPNGVLNVASIYVNLLTMAVFLDMSTESTRRFSKHPIVRFLFLFCFAYSVTPDKMAALLATCLFFIFEVKNFVVDLKDMMVPKSS